MVPKEWNSGLPFSTSSPSFLKCVYLKGRREVESPTRTVEYVVPDPDSSAWGVRYPESLVIREH